MFSPVQAVISVWLDVNMGINKQRNRGKDLTCCSRTQGDVLWRLNVLLLRRSWPLVVLLPSFIGNEQSDGARLKSTRSHNYSLEPYDITTDLRHYTLPCSLLRKSRPSYTAEETGKRKLLYKQDFFIFHSHLYLYIYIFSCVMFHCFIAYVIFILFSILLLLFFLHFPLSGPVLTYISLLIIPCMIVYVTNNKEPWTLNQPWDRPKKIHRCTNLHATHLHSIFILYIKNIHLYLYLLNLYDCSFTVL